MNGGMNSIFSNTGWFKQFFARSEKLLCCIGYAAKVINVFLKSKHCNKRFYWTDFSSLGVSGRSRAPFRVDFSVNVWKRRAAGFLIFRVCRKGKGVLARCRWAESGRSAAKCARSLPESGEFRPSTDRPVRGKCGMSFSALGNLKFRFTAFFGGLCLSS